MISKQMLATMVAGVALIGGVTLFVFSSKEPSPAAQSTPAPSASHLPGAMPKEDASQATTQQMPMRSNEPFVPPPSAATGRSPPTRDR